MRPVQWNPILEGEDLTRARDDLDGILQAIGSADDACGPFLSRGRAGLALLMTYVGVARDDRFAIAAAQHHLEHAADALANQTMWPSLFGGFAGIAWVHAHVSPRLDVADEVDSGREIDEALVDLLRQTPWNRDYDLVGGLAGIGVLLLERCQRPLAREALELLVERLAETSLDTTKGITWHTAPGLLSARQRAEHPDGFFNLGVAHGVPGVIAILAAIVAVGLGGRAAGRLLEGALDWVMTQRLPDESHAAFGHFAGERGDVPGRLAWCYGDAGIAAILCSSGSLLAHDKMYEAGVAIGRLAAARDPRTSGVVDAGLCHGAAGLGHVFNRLYHWTGDDLFRDSSRAWFARMLAMKRRGEPIGGYPAWMTDLDGRSEWRAEIGLLEGAAGVAAALLAASSDIAPDWDRFLLLSMGPPVSDSVGDPVDTRCEPVVPPTADSRSGG
jgi:lantibiotic modifying enzyme